MQIATKTEFRTHFVPPGVAKSKYFGPHPLQKATQTAPVYFFCMEGIAKTIFFSEIVFLR